MNVLHYSDKGVVNFLELYKQSDILIATGDLRFSDFSGLEFYEPKIPAFGVYGNHDDGCNYLENNKIINLHNKIIDYNGIRIGGFQGCPRYNTREMQYSEEEARVFYETFPYVDILVLHAGPLGLLDDESDPVHKGSFWIRKYVDEKTPKIIFCGHQYCDAEILYNTTQVYRSYGARFITINLL